MTAVKQEGKYHHGDLRRALVAAALHIVDHEGVEALTLRTLAARLGVSPKAPYRHFEDKSVLLAAVAVEGFHQQLTYGRQFLDPNEPIESFFVTGGMAYVRYALAHPRLYRLMYERLALEHAPPQELLKAAEAIVERIALGIERGQQEGQYRQEDPRLIAQAFWSALHGLALLAIDGRLYCAEGETPETAAATTVNLMLNGLMV